MMTISCDKTNIGVRFIPAVLFVLFVVAVSTMDTVYGFVVGGSSYPKQQLQYHNQQDQYQQWRHNHQRQYYYYSLRWSSSSSTTIEESSSSSGTFSSSSSPKTKLLNYEYDGFNLTYRTITKSSDGDNSNRNITTNFLLIHPIGVGLASWFWIPFMEAYNGDNGSDSANTIYAPNLIGCGCSEGSDSWDPNTKGLFIPLDWVRSCEAFMDHVTSDDATTGSNNHNNRWVVIAQGGLAPIGVLLASRNPHRVNQLILTSPPTWKEMTTAVPEKELKRNLNFLTNPITGNLAFSILESRSSVEFFSNQFLFSQPCDENWLNYAQTEWEIGGKTARPPVCMFNAGFCMNRSYEDELTSLEQPTMIIQGQDDQRQREEYTKLMKDATLQTIPNCQNVVPWEQPHELWNVLSSFCDMT